jgi:bacterioferritin (cytochrome b1)
MGERDNWKSQDLTAALNEDLAEEYRAIARYATIIALLRVEVANRQQHARFLADTVAALGGLPHERPQPMLTPNRPRGMLERTQPFQS